MTAYATFQRTMNETFIGRQFRDSVLNAAGYDITFMGKNRGFLGIRSNVQEIYGMGRSGATAPGLRDIYKSSRMGGASASKAASQAISKSGGRVASLAGKTAFNMLPPAMFAYSVISGYQTGGVWGATKGAGEYIGMEMALRAGLQTIGAPITIAAMATAAVGYGAYALGQAGKKYERQLRNLEIGGDENMINAINSYGASTMRQRAAVALNNSHINRRLALGNEARLFHSSYR